MDLISGRATVLRRPNWEMALPRRASRSVLPPERGSSTRSRFKVSGAMDFSAMLGMDGLLRLTEPRSNRNAVAAFNPVLADAVGLRSVNEQK